MYLVLLRGHAGPAALAEAPLVDPALPDAAPLAIAAATLVAGCLYFARRFRAVTT